MTPENRSEIARPAETHAAAATDPVRDATIARLRHVERLTATLRARIESGVSTSEDGLVAKLALRLWLTTLGHRDQHSRVRIDLVQAVRHAATARSVSGSPADRAAVAIDFVTLMHPEIGGRLDALLVENAVGAWQRRHHQWISVLRILQHANLKRQKSSSDLRKEFEAWDQRPPDCFVADGSGEIPE